jgi:capsid protein
VRGWSAARGISYVSLGNDLEAVNYSSAQVGISAERDHYRSIQRKLIRWLHRPVLEAALPYIVLATPGLNTGSLANYVAACVFVPRRWAGVDPIKTANADETNLRNKLTSRRRILLERGEDPDEVFAEIEDEEKRFGAVPAAPAAAPAATQSEQDDDDSEASDESGAAGQGA